MQATTKLLGGKKKQCNKTDLFCPYAYTDSCTGGSYPSGRSALAPASVASPEPPFPPSPCNSKSLDRSNLGFFNTFTCKGNPKSRLPLLKNIYTCRLALWGLFKTNTWNICMRGTFRSLYFRKKISKGSEWQHLTLKWQVLYVCQTALFSSVIFCVGAALLTTSLVTSLFSYGSVYALLVFLTLRMYTSCRG